MGKETLSLDEFNNRLKDEIQYTGIPRSSNRSDDYPL